MQFNQHIVNVMLNSFYIVCESLLNHYLKTQCPRNQVAYWLEAAYALQHTECDLLDWHSDYHHYYTTIFYKKQFYW